MYIYTLTVGSKSFLFIIIASAGVRSCLFCCFFWRRNNFDKVSVRAVPVKIIKSVTAAKYNSSLLFIPAHGTATATGQTSLRVGIVVRF